MARKAKLYRFEVAFLSLILLFTALSPVLIVRATTTPDASLNGDLIPCGPKSDGFAHEGCTFDDLITLAMNVINKLIVFSTFIAIGVFSFAGIKLLTSGGKQSAMTDAKAMLIKVLKGYAFILIAWVLVYTIVHTLVDPNATFDLLGSPRS